MQSLTNTASRWSKSLLIACCLVAVVGLSALPIIGFAQVADSANVRLTLDVRGHSLEDVLARLVRKAPIDIVYTLETVRGRQTACRYRSAPTGQFLRCLLDGTGLTVERLDSGTFILREQPAASRTNWVARPYPIRGHVYDAETGAALSHAAVYLPDRRQGAVTDTSGAYRLVLTADSAEVAVSHLGYRDERFEVRRGETTERTVGLVTEPLVLGAIDVTARRQLSVRTGHADSIRALYLHEQGYFAGMTTRSLNACLLVGYRWRGRIDAALYVADQPNGVFAIGPLVAYASRPSARGWGVQASLLYRLGIGDGGGRTFEDRGGDVLAAVYKRWRVRGTTLFPSIGAFVYAHPIEVTDAGRAIVGLRIALPVVLEVSAGKQLILEPTYQFSDHPFDRYDHFNLPGLDLRLNF